MKTKLQFGFAIALLLATTVVFTSVSYSGSPGTVTFRVNMNVQALLGTFNPATDSVTIHGNFTGWGNAFPAMTLLHDTIYTQTISFPSDSGLSYKYFNNDPTAPNTGYETIADNRAWTTTSGNDTLPTVWFNDDSVYTPAPPDSANVTFQCNMAVQTLKGTFTPGTDTLEVRGNFQGWGDGDTLHAVGGQDSLYTATFRIPQSQNLQYKYWANNALSWESVSNRSFDFGTTDATIPVVYFNDQNVYYPPASVNINYAVDMTAYMDLGIFEPGLNDSMHIRGQMNNWGDNTPDIMVPDIVNNALYEISTPYTGNVNDQIFYKFHINFDTTHAVGIWSNYDLNTDNYAYEHPYSTGDANRVYTIPQTSGDVYPAAYYFCGLNPKGIITDGHSVQVTFHANLGPATRNLATPFAAGDSVGIKFNDPEWCFAATGVFNTQYILWLTPTDGDSLFTGSMTVTGPIEYGVQYYIEYRHAGAIVDEGGGLGGSYNYRTRFIQPLAANSFPATYSFPVDSWLASSPYPSEVPPFTPVSGGVEPGSVAMLLQHDASWNMVSVPITTADDTVGAMFPTATSKAFSYSAGYVTNSTMSATKGYWVKFASVGANTVTGTINPSLPIAVVPGWNMIGSNAYSVAADSAELNPSPDSIISGASFFAYGNAGYSTTGLLNIGRAYWVKAKAAGTLTATPTKGAPKVVHTSVDAALASMNSITIKDASGRSQVLYVGTKEGTTVSIDRFELPPSPPAGGFDVRFASQRMAELYSVNASTPSTYTIDLNSVTFPITATWNGKSANQFTLTDGVNGKSFKPVVLTNGKSTKITASSLKSLTLTVSAITLPRVYSLKQNYPNPFNPTSNIQFDLPSASRVTLKVYDILGREVATLYDNQTLGAGTVATQFDGRSLSSGVYFYRLDANSVEHANESYSSVKKMMLIK